MNDLERIIEDCYKSDLVSDKIIKKIIEIIGQKEWQNLHNENSDVCTTMGELIITLDRIADLEKENTELRENNQFLNNLVKEKEQRGLEIQEDLLKEKEDFEKENAELKGLKDVATLIRANNDTVVTLMQLNNKLVSKSQQLTKAKELLERLLITSCNSDVLNLLPNCSEVLRVRVEAEQFLKELL